jgi:hypothetical protein
MNNNSNTTSSISLFNKNNSKNSTNCKNNIFNNALN